MGQFSNWLAGSFALVVRFHFEAAVIVVWAAAVGACIDIPLAKAEIAEDVVDRYQYAVTNIVREQEPAQWAEAQYRLGNVLLRIGQRDGTTSKFSEAIAAYHAALTEIPRNRMPVQWARVSNNIGIATFAIGEHTNDMEKIGELVAVFRQVLEERTRARNPNEWAATQKNLGIALLSLGQRKGELDALTAALWSFGEALKEFQRNRSPVEWAATEMYMGDALMRSGELGREAGDISRAIIAYEEALTVFTRTEAPRDWAIVQSKLGSALLAVSIYESGDRERAIGHRCLSGGSRGAFSGGGSSAMGSHGGQSRQCIEAFRRKPRRSDEAGRGCGDLSSVLVDAEAARVAEFMGERAEQPRGRAGCARSNRERCDKDKGVDIGISGGARRMDSRARLA